MPASARVTSRQRPGQPATADAAAELVQLGDAEAVGVEEDHLVALGTSTPTSMTVVETSTSISPAAKARIVRVLLVGGQPAVQHRGAQPGERTGGELGVQVLDGGERALRAATSSPSSSRSSWSVSPSSRAVAADPGAHDVGLVALLRPPRAPAARPGRSTRAARRAGTTLVWIGARPAGSSASTEVSRSPKTVIATVRGMGVAVMTSTWGGRAGLVGQRGSLLDAEAVLLVDHDEAEVGELRPCSSSRAWVPMTIPASPLAIRSSASRRGGLGHRAGEQRDAGAVGGAAEHAALGEVAEHRGDRAVVLLGEHLGGASSAAWPPASTTRSIARSATRVLPEPTSPWSSRFIGWSRASSLGDAARRSRAGRR